MLNRRRRLAPIPKGLRTSAWTAVGWAVIDLETTGLDPSIDSIVSVGVVLIDEGAIDTSRSFYSLVRPQIPPSPASMEVHGIRPSDLAHAPLPGEVAAHLSADMAGRLLVAHASWVEDGFLRALGARTSTALPRPIVDTARLCRAARIAHTERGREPSLELAARQLGVPVYSPHHALGDALTTAVVFLALAHRLSPGTTRPATVAQLAR